MANEILYAGVADLSTAEALAAEALFLLADRNALPQHPALIYGGSIDRKGSKVIKLPHIGLMGYDILGSGTEGTAPANTALTDGSTTVTVGPYLKSYEISDLVRLMDATGLLNAELFAMDAVVSAGATLVDIIANLVDNFSATVGSTGVDATFANFLDALTTLEIAKVEGPYLGVLHPVQWGDIRKDVGTSSGGTAQQSEDGQRILQNVGLGYKGRFWGADVFTTTRVPTANGGADRAGGVFGRGALAWCDGVAPEDSDPNMLNIAGKVLFERERNAGAQLTKYVSSVYLGASEGIDAAGVSVITDA